MRNRHFFGVGAAILLVGAVVIIPTAGIAGASPKLPKPTVSGFVASPTTLYDNGGPVVLSANVTNASSCVFSSTKPIAGLPATVACTSGAVSQTVILPANAGKKAVEYKFGLAVTGTKTVKAKAVNVTVSTTAGLEGVRSVASDAGGYCAVLSTGGVDCWGFNDYGELGDGTTYGSDTPQAVSGITDAVSITSDGYGYCAVLSTGGLDCWGSSNGYGELGNGTTGGSDTPQTVTGITDAVSVTSDSDYDGDGYCAVLSTGGVDCWGDNASGEIGNGTTGGSDGEDGYDTPQAVTGITNAVSVAGNFSVEGSDYCAVLSTGGVDCWGDNGYGELGNGTVGGPDGEDGYDTPQAVSGITDAVSVTSSDEQGEAGFCAVLSTGGVDCWGDNYFGQLGNGTTGGPDSCDSGDVCYDTPQAVSGITDAVSVTSESDGFGYDYCAVLSTGGVDCWGENYFGQLGNGTTGGPDGTDGYDTPQAVSGITNAVSTTSDGDGYCAALSAGGVDCWGDDGYGELGNGTTGGPDGEEDGYDTPQAVIGITNAVSTTSDGEGYCAMLSTSGMGCWGASSDGQLGNGTTSGPVGPNNDAYDTPQTVSP
jgi:alpha-tubulin suppressor-like RCC1 family protein